MAGSVGRKDCSPELVNWDGNSPEMYGAAMLQPENPTSKDAAISHRAVFLNILRIPQFTNLDRTLEKRAAATALIRSYYPRPQIRGGRQTIMCVPAWLRVSRQFSVDPSAVMSQK